MPQSRGMVKIVPRGSGNDLTIADAIGSAVDWAVDFLPYFLDFYNSMSGSTNEYTTRQITDTYQNFWTYLIQQGYMFYVEDLQVTFHGKNTETYRTGTGTSTGVQTNSEGYREFTFKTTISERDYDVVSGMWGKTAQNVHNRNTNLFDLVSGAAQDWWNSKTGYNIALQYLEKRQKFLRELEDVDIRISSSMFEGADVKMIDYSYTVPVGQQETIYNLKFKETKELTDVTGDTGQDAIESGATG